VKIFQYPIDGYTNQTIALDTLAELLYFDCLSLFLGAGISQSAGYPGWVDLVQSCLTEKGISFNVDSTSSTADILRAMELVKGKCADDKEYRQIVKHYLQKAFVLNYSHAQNMLLIAVGSLAMGSRRGSVSDIITFNFDDLLEWYFDLHCIKTQVISSVPYLNVTSDVTIYHPHGFLPKSTKYTDSSQLIFDALEYDLTIGDESNPWNKVCKNILSNKVGLMVGISGKDPLINNLVATTNKYLHTHKKDRPVTFLLNRKSSFDLTEKECFRRGIVPILFNTYDEIWEFLLSICQRAAAI